MTRNAKRFQHYRKILGLTQAELAAAMGYGGRKVVSHKEVGVRDVTARDLLALECLLRRAGKWKRAQAKE